MASTIAVGLVRLPAAFDPAPMLADVATTEQQHYARLAQRPLRGRQYLASRWLLRRHIATVLAMAPRDVPLQHHADGPPTLTTTPLHISLSHSGDVCMCATARDLRIGCDVERQRRGRHLHAIATQYFDISEADYLQQLDDTDLLAAFYRLWTLKEAAQKARQCGLAGGLCTPAFALQPALRCRAVPTTEPWSFAATTLAGADNHYDLALAVTGTAQPLHFSVTDHTLDPVSGQRSTSLVWEKTATAYPPRP